jgi:hypothetical protein
VTPNCWVKRTALNRWNAEIWSLHVFLLVQHHYLPFQSHSCQHTGHRKFIVRVSDFVLQLTFKEQLPFKFS